MEVVFLEDPACCWCWAFRPVDTAFHFEYGRNVRIRRVMGGLRDYPVSDVKFVVRQWSLAERVSGMPFEPGIWKKHVLQTTFQACRAVKAAHMIHPRQADLFLRRLREAFYVEKYPIDDMETILALAGDVGLDTERMQDHVTSGRADAVFQLDRQEASKNGFGFPTIMVRMPHEDDSVLLQGVVPYHELTQALSDLGVPEECRQRFQDRLPDWKRLFRLRPRLSLSELQLVTRLDRRTLERRLQTLGVTRSDSLYTYEAAVGKATAASATAPPSSAQAWHTLGN